MNFLVQLINGLAFSSVLFIVATGLSIIFGLMGTINLAYGSFYLLGAYIGFTVFNVTGNLFLGIVVAGICVGIIGLIIERTLLSLLPKGQMLPQALLTFGFVYIFMDLMRSIWGGHAKMLTLPSSLAGTIKIGVFMFPIHRIAIILIGLLIAFGLWLLQEKTRIGAVIKAGIDDREMVGAMGVNLKLYVTFCFFLGSFLAGVAGVIGTPLLGISPGLDIKVLVFALIVVIIGGVGSIEGAFLGSFIIGLVDIFGRVFFPGLALFSIYLALIVILVFKPSGILGRGR